MRRAGLCVLTALIVTAAMMPSRASSHREAPLISQDPLADNTDVYAFVDPSARIGWCSSPTSSRCSFRIAAELLAVRRTSSTRS